MGVADRSKFNLYMQEVALVLKEYDPLYFPRIDFPRITEVTSYMYLLYKSEKKIGPCG